MQKRCFACSALESAQTAPGGICSPACGSAGTFAFLLANLGTVMGEKNPLVLLFLQQEPRLEMLWLPHEGKKPHPRWFCGMKSGCEVVAGMQGAAGHVASRGQHPVHVPIPVTP